MHTKSAHFKRSNELIAICARSRVGDASIVLVRDRVYSQNDGEWHMSRHTDNLKRLIQKLQARYGDDDAVVLPVKQELDFWESMEARYLRRSSPYFERCLDGSARPYRNIVSGNAMQATSSR